MAKEQARQLELQERKRKEEEYNAKLQFEEKSKEMAKQMAEMSRDDVYAEARKKVESEVNAGGQYRPAKVEGAVQSEYAPGVTEETYFEQGKQITKLVVNRNYKVTEYQKVKWNWGGIYYFRGTESITKDMFDLETKQ